MGIDSSPNGEIEASRDSIVSAASELGKLVRTLQIFATGGKIDGKVREWENVNRDMLLLEEAKQQECLQKILETAAEVREAVDRLRLPFATWKGATDTFKVAEQELNRSTQKLKELQQYQPRIRDFRTAQEQEKWRQKEHQLRQKREGRITDLRNAMPKREQESAEAKQQADAAAAAWSPLQQQASELLQRTISSLGTMMKKMTEPVPPANHASPKRVLERPAAIVRAGKTEPLHEIIDELIRKIEIEEPGTVFQKNIVVRPAEKNDYDATVPDAWNARHAEYLREHGLAGEILDEVSRYKAMRLVEHVLEDIPARERGLVLFNLTKMLKTHLQSNDWAYKRPTESDALPCAGMGVCDIPLRNQKRCVVHLPRAGYKHEWMNCFIQFKECNRMLANVRRGISDIRYRPDLNDLPADVKKLHWKNLSDFEVWHMNGPSHVPLSGQTGATTAAHGESIAEAISVARCAITVYETALRIIGSIVTRNQSNPRDVHLYEAAREAAKITLAPHEREGERIYEDMRTQCQQAGLPLVPNLTQFLPLMYQAIGIAPSIGTSGILGARIHGYALKTKEAYDLATLSSPRDTPSPG